MSSTAHPAAPLAPIENLAAELRAILTGAAFAPLDTRWLRITGPDATRWLNGMVTNSVQSLAPGEGCYNFLLNAQGRILGDCTIYRDPTPEPPALLLETDASQIETLQAHLDRFIIMDDVELTRTDSAQHSGLLVLGPNASHSLVSAAHATLPRLGGNMAKVDLNGHQSSIFTPTAGTIPAYEVWFDSTASAEHTFRTLRTAIGTAVSPTALEVLRILSGTPRYGVDIRNTDKAHDLPQETAQDRALHFAKGCYLGQEIVERIRSRGSVHRTFAGFVLNGELPPSGTELTTESQPRPVGELTSVTSIPRAALDPSTSANVAPLQIALGYIRREALDRNLPLTYPGGTATPASLPFQLP